MQDNTQAKPKLAIGQVWKNAMGDFVEVIDYSPGGSCPWIGSDRNIYKDDGGYRVDGTRSPFDLVELVKDTPTQATKPVVKHIYFYSATFNQRGSQTNASGLYVSHGVKMQSEADYAEFLRCTANTLGAAHGELHVSSLSYLGESE